MLSEILTDLSAYAIIFIAKNYFLSLRGATGGSDVAISGTLFSNNILFLNNRV